MAAICIQAYTFKPDKVYEGLIALFQLNELREKVGLPKASILFADTKPEGGAQLLQLIEYPDIVGWAQEHDMVQNRMEIRRFLTDELAPMLDRSNGAQVYKVIGEGFIDAVRHIQALEAAGMDISQMGPPPGVGPGSGRGGPPPGFSPGGGPPPGFNPGSGGPPPGLNPGSGGPPPGFRPGGGPPPGFHPGGPPAGAGSEEEDSK